MKELNELSDFYITSDTWFGRNNILEIGKRSTSFSDVQDMNIKIINKWNNLIKKTDTVLHLGNFAWDPITSESILSKLNGNIYFICSNDDISLIETAKKFKNVKIIKQQILILPKHNSVFCHYPLYAWPGMESGSIHFHGHTIYSHKSNLNITNRFNMCMDEWNYEPIKISTLKELVNES